MSQHPLRVRILYLLLVLGLLVVVLYWVSRRGQAPQENFAVVPDIDFYVITMGQPERERNIQSQIDEQMAGMQEGRPEDRFHFTIHRIDAVVGQKLDLDALIAEGRLFEGIYIDDPEHRITEFNGKLANRKNEVGCYLSHYKTYEAIRDGGHREGYSVIFEDDFVLDPAFMTVLDETLVKLQTRDDDFDFLFLGILGDVGAPVVDNVYRTTGVSWCAHGYLVNNKHIDRILEKMWYINEILDTQIFNKGNQGELTVWRLYPTIVDQGNYGTGIRNH